jgi:hypothetical protein
VFAVSASVNLCNGKQWSASEPFIRMIKQVSEAILWVIDERLIQKVSLLAKRH